MNIYAIRRKIVTPARFSIDGKRHITTNYYKGTDSFRFGNVMNWCNNKKEAYKFTNKKEADKFAKRYNCEVIKL